MIRVGRISGQEIRSVLSIQNRIPYRKDTIQIGNSWKNISPPPVRSQEDMT